MKKNILIIAAHPDDETLGCGAYIYQNSKKNNIKVIKIQKKIILKLFFLERVHLVDLRKITMKR